MNDAESSVTHVLDQSTRLFHTALVNEIDSQKTGATKYFSANTHAHFLGCHFVITNMMLLQVLKQVDWK
ncbi:hypothetical protein SporoS204_12530 [Sporosarcina ureae]|uniref:Uncharacterized protein n=1 Tax=Sporosarcina ureae TaxID=1571 RepID=A0ABN4YSU5_SPOUR|nr:hypothetical protein SporoS204_12530 [Sporosarcina ureae]